MRKVMIVAGDDSSAHRIVTTGRPGLHIAPIELDQYRFRRRFGISLHRERNRHLIAELWPFDIDLRDYGATRDQFALLGGPLRQARAEREDEIAFRDQFVGNRRREAAADADRPWISRKQSVAAHRGRKQRADTVGKR